MFQALERFIPRLGTFSGVHSKNLCSENTVALSAASGTRTRTAFMAKGF